MSLAGPVRVRRVDVADELRAVDTLTQRHHKWLARQSFEQPAIQFALDLGVEQCCSPRRRDRLEKAISAMARDSQWSRS